MRMKVSMLTTTDNPYNPFDNFDSWLRFDLDKGYNTCGLLARHTNIDDSFSDEEVNEENERAIKEIIVLDPLNMYTKVSKEVDEQP